MEKKILNEISKFRLYSNYNPELTLIENFNIINENIGPEIKKLFQALTKSGKTELKKFFTGKSIKDTLGNELKTVDDLLIAIEKETLSQDSLKEIKTFFINNSKNAEYVNTLIDNMVRSEGFIKKYSQYTVEEAKKQLIAKGYTPDKTQSIINKFVDNGNKFKKPAVELIQSEIKAIQDAMSELEGKASKEISRNASLRIYLNEAKRMIKNLNKETISKLSLSQQTDLKAIEAALKDKSPSLYQEVTKYTHKLPKKVKVVGTILAILFIGSKFVGFDNLGKLVGGLINLTSQSTKDFFSGLSNTINKTNNQSGYTDSLESFKKFLKDKGNKNFNSATYDSTNGIYFINGVDYEFDSTTKTFR